MGENIEHPTANAERPMPGRVRTVVHSTFDVQRSMFDVSPFGSGRFLIGQTPGRVRGWRCVSKGARQRALSGAVELWHGMMPDESFFPAPCVLNAEPRTSNAERPIPDRARAGCHWTFEVRRSMFDVSPFVSATPPGCGFFSHRSGGIARAQPPANFCHPSGMKRGGRFAETMQKCPISSLIQPNPASSSLFEGERGGQVRSAECGVWSWEVASHHITKSTLHHISHHTHITLSRVKSMLHHITSHIFLIFFTERRRKLGLQFRRGLLHCDGVGLLVCGFVPAAWPGRRPARCHPHFLVAWL